MTGRGTIGILLKIDEKIAAVFCCYIGTCHNGRCFFHALREPVMVPFLRQVGVWHPESRALQLRLAEILPNSQLPFQKSIRKSGIRSHSLRCKQAPEAGPR